MLLKGVSRGRREAHPGAPPLFEVEERLQVEGHGERRERGVVHEDPEESQTLVQRRRPRGGPPLALPQPRAETPHEGGEVGGGLERGVEGVLAAPRRRVDDPRAVRPPVGEVGQLDCGANLVGMVWQQRLGAA